MFENNQEKCKNLVAERLVELVDKLSSHLGKPDWSRRKYQREKLQNSRQVNDVQGHLSNHQHQSGAESVIKKVFRRAHASHRKLQNKLNYNLKLKAIFEGLWRTAKPLCELDKVHQTANPYEPFPQGTQTSPDLAKIGHLTTYALKNDVKRSIIQQITIWGYLDFTPLDLTHINCNPTI
ncbi:hypothetical protein H5410_061989 [Solanum commersonii]|uniref:Uncharacterized protein n=1 Tax=Solanum commersonii TaxID=4109 RepID=A0A9J5WA69_SOLCO|nr:hypothetical protein H5410_061989 [Solanum commersonii]